MRPDRHQGQGHSVEDALRVVKDYLMSFHVSRELLSHMPTFYSAGGPGWTISGAMPLAECGITRRPDLVASHSRNSRCNGSVATLYKRSAAWRKWRIRKRIGFPNPRSNS